MPLLVHSLSNEKLSSQISIILWFFGPSQSSQYIINVFNKKTHRIKKNIKTCFIEKLKKTKYVLNNYAMQKEAERLVER